MTRFSIEEGSSAARAFLKQVLDAAPDAMFIKDRDHRYVFVNDACCRLLGVTREQVIGRTDYDFGPRAQADSFRETSEHAFLTGEASETEEEITNLKGRRLVIIKKKSVIADENGAQYLIGILSDITERKRMESELRERENQLRHSREHLTRAQQIGHVGSAELDLKTGELHWSDELYSILGLDPARVKPDVELYRAAFHPDDRALQMHVHDQALNGQPHEPVELRVVHPDGQVRWVLRRTALIRDESGEPLSVALALQDITERKQMEAELRAREEQLRRSQDHLERAQRIGHFGSAELDLATGTYLWSDELFHVLGLDPATVEPSLENYRNAFHPDDRDLLHQLHVQTIEGHSVEPTELRVVWPGNEIRWVLRHAALVRDEQGSPERLAVSLQDITDLKRLEIQLREQERALRRSREHLTQAQTVGRVGSTEVDLRTGEVLWSDHVYQLLGIGKSVTPGLETFAEAVHPDDRDMIRDISRRARRGEVVEPVEFRVVRPDGDVRWIYRVSELLREDNGTPASVVTMISDITDRKRLEIQLRQREEDLRRNREHLARAQTVGAIGSAEVDMVTGRTVWSEQMYRLMGLDPGVDPSNVDAFANRVHPDDLEGMLDRRRRMRRGEEVAPTEYRLILPDGSLRWVFRQQEFIRDAAGKPVTAIVILQDITDRKRLELQLRQREEELGRNREDLARAQTVGGIGSAVVDLVTGEVHWSDELYRLIGSEPGQGAPNVDTLARVVHPDDRGPVREAAARLRRLEDVPPMEFRILREDGEIRWGYRQQKFVTDATGRPATAIVTIQDITARKVAAEKLRAAKDAAEAAERALAKKNVELLKAYRRLEEASLTDPLTGLRNRRFLQEHFDADVALTIRLHEQVMRQPNRRPRLKSDLVFFLVDIDYFKRINDRYGHAAGDQVLMQMRLRLQEVFRGSDYLVRWGGEEFLAVARSVLRKEADAVAERIRATVASRPFDIGEGERVAATCSVGFASFPFLPEQPRLLTWPQVVELADQALYVAKRGGRNAWVGLFGTAHTQPQELFQRLVRNPAGVVATGELRVATSLPAIDESMWPASDRTGDRLAQASAGPAKDD